MRKSDPGLTLAGAFSVVALGGRLEVPGGQVGELGLLVEMPLK